MSIEQYRRFSEWAETSPVPDPESEDFDSLLDGLDPLVADVVKHLPGQHDQRTHGPDEDAPRLFDPGDAMTTPTEGDFWSQFGEQERMDVAAATEWDFDYDDLREDKHGRYWRYAQYEFDMEGHDYTVMGVDGRGDDLHEQVARYLHDHDRLRDPDPITTALQREVGTPQDYGRFREEAFVVRSDLTGGEQVLLYREGKTGGSVAFSAGDLPLMAGSDVIHSHPSTSPLSTGDLVFAHQTGARSITALGSEGLVYTATFDPDHDGSSDAFYWAVALFSKAIDDLLADSMMADIPSIAVNMDEANIIWESRRFANMRLGGHMKQHILNEFIGRYVAGVTIQHNADSNPLVQRLWAETEYEMWGSTLEERFIDLMASSPDEIREKANTIEWEKFL